MEDKYIIRDVREVGSTAYGVFPQECNLLSRVAHHNDVYVLRLCILLEFNDELCLLRVFLPIIGVNVEGGKVVDDDHLHFLPLDQIPYIAEYLLEVVAIVVIIEEQLVVEPRGDFLRVLTRYIVEVIKADFPFRVGLSRRYLHYPILKPPILHLTTPYTDLETLVNGIECEAVEPRSLA